MNKAKWQQLVAAALMVALLTASFAPVAMAASEAAPIAQTQSAEVTGTIPGGQFAKIWLGLKPINPGQVVVTAEWDRADALASGLGFYVLSPENLSAVNSGSSLSANNVGAGSEKFFLNGPTNVQGAAFRAIGSDYTIVVYNDSPSDANFKLKAENGLIVDDSDQVTAPGAEATAEATTAPDGEATPEATVAAETPAAAVTVTTTTEAVATPAATVAATAPATVTLAAGPVKGQVFTGTLPNQYDQHILALAPSNRDGEVTLTLAFDPQDSTELARRINFWVMDQEAFKRYLAGDAPSAVAVAAGSRESGNTRATTFKTAGFGPYSVIVYNNSRVPAEYSLRVDGGMLEDDSNQTITAQLANGGTTAVAAPAADAAAPAAVAATTATTGTAATTNTGVQGEKGGTYTVKSGDTLAIIARDIYGDYTLYEELCAFNKIADCNVIEVGQVINLPTDAQIGATTTTTAAATPAATAVATATPAATAVVTPTTAVTSTAAAATPVAPTTPLTGTTPTTPTTTSPTTGGAATTTDTIVDVATKNGNFTTLLAALKAAGLDTALEGSGPYTVFAPTDAAFDAFLSSNNLTEDLLLRAKELPGVLQYHVLSGKVLSADITNGSKATTLQGKPVTFEIKDGKVYVNGAQVVTADIPAANGVIHVIDTVILPPQQ